MEEIILECRQKHITRVDLLGFEFEMGLFPNVLDEARAKGIDIAPKDIPAEVFDKRAVEKNQVVFHDVAAIEVKVHVGAGLASPKETARGEGKPSPYNRTGTTNAGTVGAGLALPSSGKKGTASRGTDKMGTASRTPTVAVELTDFSVFYSQDSLPMPKQPSSRSPARLWWNAGRS